MVAPHLREPGSCTLMLRLEEIVRDYFLRSNILAACSPFTADEKAVSGLLVRLQNSGCCLMSSRQVGVHGDTSRWDAPPVSGWILTGMKTAAVSVR